MDSRELKRKLIEVPREHITRDVFNAVFDVMCGNTHFETKRAITWQMADVKETERATFHELIQYKFNQET